MPLGFIPINHSPAVMRVDLPVHRASDSAAIVDACCLDAPEDRIELRLADAEAEMLDGKRLVRRDEIQRQAVIDVHGKERPFPRRSARNSEQISQHFGRSVPVMRDTIT